MSVDCAQLACKAWKSRCGVCIYGFSRFSAGAQSHTVTRLHTAVVFSMIGTDRP